MEYAIAIQAIAIIALINLLGKTLDRQNWRDRFKD
jgi:hypothetical protein